MTTKDIDYIQFFLNDKEMDEVTAPFLAYKNAKEMNSNKMAFQTYKAMMLQRFQGNQDEMTNYINTARNLVNNKSFQGALDNALNNLSMPEYTNRKVFAMQGYLQQNAQEYQKLVNEVTQAITAITNILGVANLDAIVPGTPAYDALKRMYDDQGKDFDRVITLAQHQDLARTFAGQYRYLLSLLPSFAEAQSTNNTAAAVQILGKLLIPIQTLIGICNEYQVELEVNKLLEPIEKDLTKSLTVQRVGDDSDVEDGFRIGTADLSATINQGTSTVNFNVPNLGMSLKRSHKNLDQVKEVNIKLKGTTFGKLMNELDPRLVTQFYTIYANTQPILNGVRQKALPGGAISSAYAMMKAQCLIPALIGNLDSENLVSIFIINNKAYTIFDMLESIANATSDDDSTGTGVLMKNLSFSSGRKIAQSANQYIDSDNTGITRSNKVRAAINKISTSIYLQLRMSDLRRR